MCVAIRTCQGCPQIYLPLQQSSINVGLHPPHLLLSMAAEPLLCFTMRLLPLPEPRRRQGAF